MNIFKKKPVLWSVLGLVGVGLIFTFLAIRLVNSIDYHNQDFFTFWLAGHLVTQGGNPYAPDQWVSGHYQFNVSWIPNQAFVYPLPLSQLFAPLGMLPLKDAYIIWVALSAALILVALILLCFKRLDLKSGMIFIPILLGTILFRPTTLTLVNGQISGFLLLLLTGTLTLWDKGKWEWGCLLLSFLFLKPNIGAPILGILSIWLLVRKRYKPLAVTIIGVLALVALGMIQNPRWVLEYWGIGSLKVAQNFGAPPTVWGLSNLICHNQWPCLYTFGGIGCLFFVLAFFWLVLRNKSLKPSVVLALAVVVTLLITPYIWTYDQLLLIIPVILITFKSDPQERKYPISSLLLFGLDLLVVILLVFDEIYHFEIFNVFIPLIVFCLYLLFLFRPSPGWIEQGTA